MKLYFKHFLILFIGCISPCMTDRVCHKMAWGSCFKHLGTEDTSILQQISDKKPDSFVWLGDIAYTDAQTYRGPEYGKMEQEVKYRRVLGETYSDPNFM